MLYAVQIFSSSNPDKTSSNMMLIDVTPLSRLVYRTATTSSQPQRRGRLVTVPYSLPRSRKRWPRGLSNSVGKGPPPTRVEYALTTPMIRPICRAGTPEPLEMPTPELLLLVTNGYVPWSTSNNAP